MSSQMAAMQATNSKTRSKVMGTGLWRSSSAPIPQKASCFCPGAGWLNVSLHGWADAAASPPRPGWHQRSLRIWTSCPPAAACPRCRASLSRSSCLAAAQERQLRNLLGISETGWSGTAMPPDAPALQAGLSEPQSSFDNHGLGAVHRPSDQKPGATLAARARCASQQSNPR